MRTLLLLRGLPGSGKSTFIRQKGLEPYTLSADGIRMLYGSPVLQANGLMRTPAEFDRIVWQKIVELLESRMYRGELLVVDATHTHPRSFKVYRSLVQKHRYWAVCIDFSDVPFEVSMERNLSRAPYMVVPPVEMMRMQQNMQKTRIPEWIHTIKPDEIDGYLKVLPEDASKYKAVHHIGDVQGCFTPLKDYFDRYGIKDDELYVFVGDYIDRGTQNAEVMTWLLENYHRPNLIFLEGNHEAHLRNWAKGIVSRSEQFNKATAPQLEAAGIVPEKVAQFVHTLREMYYYMFHGRTVLVSHGGLSTLPEEIAYINAMQFVKGAGAYEEADISDESFTATTGPETYQVHGHRNRQSAPTRSSARTFNLEGKVEFGGELRTVTLTEKGFEERPIKSSIDASGSLIE